uniref:Uncharacterized protein n=1 Tax=Caldisericum exile TaxID=693075 RepID=A0A7C4TVI6_9BACT
MNFFNLLFFSSAYVAISSGIILLIFGIFHLFGLKSSRDKIKIYLSSAILGVIFYLSLYFLATVFARIPFSEKIFAPLYSLLILIGFPVFSFLRSKNIKKGGIWAVDKIILSELPLAVFYFAPFYLMETNVREIVLYSQFVWKYFPLYFILLFFLGLLNNKMSNKISTFGIIISLLLIMAFLFAVPVKVRVDKEANFSFKGLAFTLKKPQLNVETNLYEGMFKAFSFLPVEVSITRENDTKNVRFVPIAGSEVDISTFMETNGSNYAFDHGIKINCKFNKPESIGSDEDGTLVFKGENYSSLYFVSPKTKQIKVLTLKQTRDDFYWSFVFPLKDKLVLVNPREIYEFDKSGNFISKKPFPYEMQSDYYDKQFFVTEDCTIYAIDGKYIYLVESNGKAKRIPYKIDDNGELFITTGLTVNSKGEVFLCAMNSEYIYKFSDGKILRFAKAEIPSSGSNMKGFQAIAIGNNDHLFALANTDSGFASIEEFDEHGKIIGTFGCSTPSVTGAIVLGYSKECINSHSYLYSLTVTKDGTYVALLEADPLTDNLIIKIFSSNNKK